MKEPGRFYRRFGLAGGLVLGICLLLVSHSQGGNVSNNFNDNFNDNLLNANLWQVQIWGTGPTVNETNSRLEITFPPNSTGSMLMAGVRSQFTLVGDFDAQVDFTLLSWPAANGANVSLGAAGSFNFGISRYSYGFFDKEGYLFGHLGSLFSVPTSGTTGKLRLKRTGTTMETFYWQNNAWHSMGAYSDAQYAAPIPIFLYADFGTPTRFIPGELVQVAYDNFQVTDGKTGKGLSFLSLLLN